MVQGEVPEWAVVPPDLKVPAGRVMMFVRFRAQWTDAPHKGDRQCIVWSLTDADEKAALNRCMGDANRAASEYTRQMIRAVDGCVARHDIPHGSGSLDEFWTEIGAKCRILLLRLYTKWHSPTEEEIQDFFENCVAARTAG